YLVSCPRAHPDLHPFPTRRSSDLGESGWLAESLGMGEPAQVAFVDFVALAMLHRLRLSGGQLIYELGLHRGGEHAIHRAVYAGTDRKSTRLNSSHQIISYAVFCWK